MRLLLLLLGISRCCSSLLIMLHHFSCLTLQPPPYQLQMFNFLWRNKGDINDPAQFRAMFTKDEISALYGRFGTARQQHDEAEKAYDEVRGLAIFIVRYRFT